MVAYCDNQCLKNNSKVNRGKAKAGSSELEASPVLWRLFERVGDVIREPAEQPQ